MRDILIPALLSSSIVVIMGSYNSSSKATKKVIPSMLMRAKMTIELPIGDYHSTNLSTRLLLHKVSLSTPDHNPILYTSFFTDSKSVVHTQKVL